MSKAADPRKQVTVPFLLLRFHGELQYHLEHPIPRDLRIDASQVSLQYCELVLNSCRHML
jgi:hypothetical protein